MGSYLNYKVSPFFLIIYIKNFVFIYFIIFGTFLVIRSSSWFIRWVGLELNLLSFIPVIITRKRVEDSECGIRYFLIQSIGSIILLFGVILNSISLEGIIGLRNLENISIIIIFISLILKVGLPPFHYWFPEVVLRLDWISNIFLLTWQKLGPFILIRYVLEILNKYTFFFIVIFRILIGGLGGLNQTSVKKIMAFSSINHIGWMLSALYVSLRIWFIYYLIYSILRICIIIIFWSFNINYFSDLTNIRVRPVLKSLIFINILSLGGLPPFVGFFPKWLVLEFMGLNNLWILISLIVFITIISLYFYMRLIFISIITYNNKIFNSLKFGQMNFLVFKKNYVFISLATSLNLLGLLYILLI